jgi:hypothetical protein
MKKKKIENEFHCGECNKLVWNTNFENLDCKGIPIHGYCPVSKQNQIRTEPACSAFTPQTDDSQNYYKLSRWDLKSGFEKS